MTIGYAYITYTNVVSNLEKILRKEIKDNYKRS